MKYRIDRNENGKFKAEYLYYEDYGWRWILERYYDSADGFFPSMTAAQDALKERAEVLDRALRAKIWSKVAEGEF